MKCMSLILLGCFCLTHAQDAGILENTGNNINAVSNTRLCDCVMQKEIYQLKERLDGLQEELRKMKDTPRVAFSATLSAGNTINLGPFNTATTIVFPNVILNLGSGYNPNTGIFTAHARGVYHFSYTLFLYQISNVYASLMKNGDRVLSTWDADADDISDSTSNTAILQLEVGDNVFVRLHDSKQIYDDAAKYTSFSGFLLYLL